jgi:hypothetical protein
MGKQMHTAILAKTTDYCSFQSRPENRRSNMDGVVSVSSSVADRTVKAPEKDS